MSAAKSVSRRTRYSRRGQRPAEPLSRVSPPGTTGIGVWGQTPGTGSAVYGEATGSGVGVYGDTTNGTGVIARSTNGTALSVNGKAKFSRSGTIVIPAGTASRTVTLAGVTTASMVLATSQQTANVFVRSAVPGSGSFTIRLSGVAPAQASRSPTSYSTDGCANPSPSRTLKPMQGNFHDRSASYLLRRPILTCWATVPSRTSSQYVAFGSAINLVFRL